MKQEAGYVQSHFASDEFESKSLDELDFREAFTKRCMKFELGTVTLATGFVSSLKICY